MCCLCAVVLGGALCFGLSLDYCADCWGCFVFCGFGRVDVVGGFRMG